MATRSLPARPRLSRLRREARELQRERGLRLHEAQLALARGYGFASWARLKHHVEVLEERTWVPPTADTDPLTRLVRAGCWTLDGTVPAPEQVDALVAQVPDLASRDLAAAVVLADVDAVRRHLGAGADAGAACGPLRWPPLMYLTYARPRSSQPDVLACAQVLVDAGADAGDGRYVSGFPTPFTVLTGLFGGGEQAVPEHPHAEPLARLLVAAGADPNDGQTVYDRMFEPDDRWLRLLLDHGLGHGDGGVWRRRLPDLTPAPAVLVRQLLSWAVVHDQRARVSLLAEHGVDLDAPLPDGPGPLRGGHTPWQAAVSHGHAALADDLARRGAATGDLDPVDELVGALLRGDEQAVAATPPEVVDRLRESRPGLVVWAAARGGAAAVDLLLGLGFDLDALGRGDVPLEHPWQTALHTAVERDDADLVEHLLALGADTSVVDARFGATAAQWAEHLGHRRVADLLAAPRLER